MSHQAIGLVLSPVLLAQALGVRRRALVLPEASGPRQGTSGSGPRLRLLIVGDSSAAGVGVATQDQALAGQIVAALALRRRVDWRLVARTGATTRGTLARLTAGLEGGVVDHAVTALGVNDLTGGTLLPRWRDQQLRLWDTLTTTYGARRIVVSGVPPMGGFPVLPQPLRWVLGQRAAIFDDALRRMTEGLPHVTHLQMDFTAADRGLMAADGFHPGPAIYAQWGRAIAAAILPEEPPP